MQYLRLQGWSQKKMASISWRGLILPSCESTVKCEVSRKLTVRHCLADSLVLDCLRIVILLRLVTGNSIRSKGSKQKNNMGNSCCCSDTAKKTSDNQSGQLNLMPIAEPLPPFPKAAVAEPNYPVFVGKYDYDSRNRRRFELQKGRPFVHRQYRRGRLVVCSFQRE